MRLMPDLPFSPDDLETVASQPTYYLYQWIFAICLMHATYRPKDPQQVLWVLTEDATQGHWEGFDLCPPTRIIGLYLVPDTDVTLLVWGNVECVGINDLEVHLTVYDSEAIIRSDESMMECVVPVSAKIKAALSPTFTVGRVTGFQGTWPSRLLALSEEDRGFLFCQLISVVVHDGPYDTKLLLEGPPVYPVWPVELTRDKTHALLSQVSHGILRLEDVLEGGGLVPDCIYLHG
jgi:hypothetical protein